MRVPVFFIRVFFYKQLEISNQTLVGAKNKHFFNDQSNFHGNLRNEPSNSIYQSLLILNFKLFKYFIKLCVTPCCVLKKLRVFVLMIEERLIADI